MSLVLAVFAALAATAGALRPQRLSRARAPPRPITFVTIKDDFFGTNLARSQLWIDRAQEPHEWMVIENTENRNISSVYAEAKERAQHDLVVFLHDDVFLPEGFYADMMQRLAALEAHDPNWGVAGAVGIVGKDQAVIQNIQDSYGTRRDFNTDRSLEAAFAFDELLLVLRKSSSVNFDPQLPGFDLYGLDIVQQTHAQNLTAYVLPVYVQHKVHDPEGAMYDEDMHWSKILTDAYADRVNITAEYLVNKWCDKGMRCSIGTFFILSCRTRALTLRNVLPLSAESIANSTKWAKSLYKQVDLDQCLADNGLVVP